MKVLLLGVGMQGKAALYDLATSEPGIEVVAADGDLTQLEREVAARGYANVSCEGVDANDTASLARLMASEVKVVVCLLPGGFAEKVARAAINAGAHFVNTSYLQPGLKSLADEAESKGVSILPEFGLDPGIDLVMLGEAIRRLDTVESVRSYGSGIPEPAAADNPLRYKVSWRFENVLAAYRRPARLMLDCEVIDIGDREQFDPKHLHTIDVDGLGQLEAYPNGDAMKYAEFLQDSSSLSEMARYTCRWPGHAAFWKKMVDLGFLDTDPIDMNGTAVGPRQFLAALLEPQLQYGDRERDVVHIRVDVRGRAASQEKHIVFELLDMKDLATGFTAMNRTVGFTASIGAQMLLARKIGEPGLLSPVRDVPWELLAGELHKRNINVTCNTQGE